MEVEAPPAAMDEMEMTSKGPMTMPPFEKSLTTGRALTTMAVLSRARKTAVIAYNAFLAVDAVSTLGEVCACSEHYPLYFTRIAFVKLIYVMLPAKQTCVTIPTSYADVSTFKFGRVFKDTPEEERLFDSISDLIDPTELGRAVAVVVCVLHDTLLC